MNELRALILGHAARQYLDHEEGVTGGWLAWTVFERRWTGLQVHAELEALVNEGVFEHGNVSSYHFSERAEGVLHQLVDRNRRWLTTRECLL